MKKSILILMISLAVQYSFAQRTEKVYLNPADSSSNGYIAVVPDHQPVKAFMFLLDGFGASPRSVLKETDIPVYAAQQGILTIVPILSTGPYFFGADDASQKSLKEQIASVAEKYSLQGKDFYIGGLSIGGTCAVKYAELAVEKNYPVKPKAVFAVDPPLDFERFYNEAKRVVRLSAPGEVNEEVTYMIKRIEKEMGGTPQAVQENYYNISPYSFSDTSQRAVKKLINTPIMLITEPDIQWWLKERGYDYSYLNVTDLAAMVNELHHLGNDKAILITTENKGFRKQTNTRHPHSWSIADKEELVKWLFAR